MHDFGQIVYLDLQKTGPTFVSAFLDDERVKKVNASKTKIMIEEIEPKMVARIEEREWIYKAYCDRARNAFSYMLDTAS